MKMRMKRSLCSEFNVLVELWSKVRQIKTILLSLFNQTDNRSIILLWTEHNDLQSSVTGRKEELIQTSCESEPSQNQDRGHNGSAAL